MKLSLRLVNRFGGVLLLVLVCNVDRSFAQDKSGSVVVQKWQEYFKGIHSLHVDSTLNISSPGDKIGAGPSWKMKFFSQGNKYRSDVRLPGGTKGASSLSMAYDGSHYQVLQAGEDAVLTRSVTANLSNKNPYLGSQPLFLIFPFVFEANDIQNMETVQQPITWKRLLRRVSNVKSAKVGDKVQDVITIDAPAAGRVPVNRYEVTMDPDSALPVGLKKIQNSTNRVLADLKVTNFTNVSSNGASFKIPLGIEVKGSEAGKPNELVKVEVNPKTLQVNAPIAREIFTLPVNPGLRVVDEEDMMKIPNKPDDGSLSN